MNPIGAIFWKDLKSLVRNKSIYTVSLVILAFVFALSKMSFPNNPFWISVLAGSAISALVYFVADEFERYKKQGS